MYIKTGRIFIWGWGVFQQHFLPKWNIVKQNNAITNNMTLLLLETK